MFFYQIYDELQIIHERCTNIEEHLMDNQAVTVQNRKNEVKLHQRVDRLEEEIKFLKMLPTKYNEMVTTINMVINELNAIISLVNNNKD